MPTNGRLNTADLVKVDGWAYLAPNTAAAWNGACAEVVSLGYPRPTITAPDGAYRNIAGQVCWKAYWTAKGKPGNAATPGYSNHGWGTSVDIWNVARFPRAVLREVFARHGFSFPVLTEDWHAQHDGTAPAGGGYIPIEETKEHTMAQFAFTPEGGGYIITEDGALAMSAFEWACEQKLTAAQTNPAGATRLAVNELAAVSELRRRVSRAAALVPASQVDAIVSGIVAALPGVDQAAITIAVKEAVISTVPTAEVIADAVRARIIKE